MVLIRLDREPSIIPIMSGDRGKGYCWTLNNYTDGELMELRTLGLHPDVQYMVFGREVGALCGTPHLQGYILFKSKKRIGAARALMPQRVADFKLRRKTHKEARNYCQKDGDFEEFGTDPYPGEGKAKRAESDIDYDSVIAAIADGKPLKEITEEYPELALRSFASLKAVYGLFQPAFKFTRFNGPHGSHFPYDWDRTKSLILIGEPGIGKTQWALCQFERPMLCRNLNALRAYDSNLFDGLVVDDCDFTGRPRSDILNILEVEQPCSFRVLYGVASVPAGVPRIFCFNPGYEAIDFNDPAVRRRCHIERIVNW